MVRELIFAYWFFLPAGLSNAAPVFANIIPGIKRLDHPIDGGRHWRGKPLLGPHKTWRGIIAGMILATIILYLQQLAAGEWAWARYASGTLNYATLPVLILGPLFGLGALGGDAIESFFKRRLSHASGEKWVPFDQIDYILGGILLSLFVVQLRLLDYVVILALYFVLHLAGSYLGYLLNLKDAPI